MNQALCAQPTSITSINHHFRQQSVNPSEPHEESAKGRRSRGVFLSHQGLQKLAQAGVLYDKFGKRHTYEYLNERSQLNERTISKLLSCEVKVDINTLKTFFYAFNVPLEAGDFTVFRGDKTDALAPMPTYADSTIQRAEFEAEFEKVVEELAQLKQRLKAYDRLFSLLGLEESHVGERGYQVNPRGEIDGKITPGFSLSCSLLGRYYGQK